MAFDFLIDPLQFDLLKILDLAEVLDTEYGTFEMGCISVKVTKESQRKSKGKND